MKIYQLIEILEQYDGDSEIRIAEQPNYPFEYSIEGVAEKDGTFYIVEGRQIDYLSRDVWDNVER